MLEPVGVPDFEETVLRALLAAGSRTAADLAAELGAPADAAGKALLRLADLGLAVSDGHAYSAADPRAALSDALRERRTELDQVGREVDALSAAFRERYGPVNRLIEVVEGSAAVAGCFRDALSCAEREVVAFGMPPFVPGDAALEISLLARRVACRTVYASASLDLPERAERIRALAGLGGQARVLPEVPLAMVLVDGREALVPGAGARHTVVLRHAGLCDALAALFEAVWTQAAPLFGRSREHSPGLDPEDHAILQLLNAGLTDDVIARQLGISERTVRRRVAELAARLGAGSRFQIGAQAVRRGWLV